MPDGYSHPTTCAAQSLDVQLTLDGIPPYLSVFMMFSS